jgi:hypothetical protein
MPVTILIIIAIIFILAPIAQGYARRLNPPDLPGISPRDVARLREELDQLIAQVSRLQDEQSFMLRLLSEGDPASRKLGRGEGEADEGSSRSELRGGGQHDDDSRTQSDTRDGGL